MTTDPTGARRRALSFGTAGEAYERYRPGYPDELVGWLLDEVSGPVRRALEVGAGTGKATRVFAGAGIEVTAVEPDPAMLEVLVRTCAGLPVHPVRATFEEVPADGAPYDLLYAAASWHWTSPEGRLDRVASLVRPGGLVAFFGGALELADERLAALEEAVLERFHPGVQAAGPVTVGHGLAWPGDELAADPRFVDVRQRTIPRRYDVDRSELLGYLDTVSAYRVLAEDDRAAALTELASSLPDRVAVLADVVAHTARLVAADS